MPSLVEIGPVVQENKIFQCRQCIFAISLLSPVGNGRGLLFEQTYIPFTKDCFVPSLVENGSVVLEKIFFYFVNLFLLFRNYLPFEKG